MKSNGRYKQNFVVESRIAHPKEIEALYAELPETARKAIEKRDEGAAPNNWLHRYNLTACDQVEGESKGWCKRIVNSGDTLLNSPHFDAI